MSDILLEVDDELRSQQIKALWDKYGQVAIGLGLAAVVASAIGVFWHNYKNSELSKGTTALLSASENQTLDSTALTTVLKTSPSPLRDIVSLQLAQAQETENSLDDAQRTYDDIAKGASNMIVRHIATYHSVRLGMILKQDTNDLLKRIKPLTDVKNAMHGSAMELEGLLLASAGKKDEANSVFQAMIDDVSISNSLRQRAHMYMDYGSGDAK